MKHSITNMLAYIMLVVVFYGLSAIMAYYTVMGLTWDIRLTSLISFVSYTSFLVYDRVALYIIEQRHKSSRREL